MHIEFTEEGHTYLVDGAPYPSVTQILKAEGLSDYQFANAGHRDRGAKVHQICELIDQGWPDGVPPAVTDPEEIIERSPWLPAGTDPDWVGYGYGYARYLLAFRPKWKLIESAVASKVYGFAGRLDRHGEAISKPLTVDIKSGEPGDSAEPQVALYGLALTETYGLDPGEKYALWLRKDGTFKKVPGNGTGLSVGISAVILYRYRKQRGLFS